MRLQTSVKVSQMIVSSPNLVFAHKELEGHHTILLYLHEFPRMVMCNFFPLSRNTLITLKHNRGTLSYLLKEEESFYLLFFFNYLLEIATTSPSSRMAAKRLICLLM